MHSIINLAEYTVFRACKQRKNKKIHLCGKFVHNALRIKLLINNHLSNNNNNNTCNNNNNNNNNDNINNNNIIHNTGLRFWYLPSVTSLWEI